MNFGQDEQDDSSSKETAVAAEEEVAVEHHQHRQEDEEDEEEEEEEEDEAGLLAAAASPNLHFAFNNNNPSSAQSSSSPSVIQYQNFLPQHHGGGLLFSPDTSPSSTGFNFEDRRPNFVDLSLGNSNETDLHRGAAGPSGAATMVEKEHMFDKVVTPSDVGKLNRLVIPKQHAEKYFPLDSSSNEKGLLLNFEDRNGKPWQFRYSYWNSSQSYVMTKGWSRFVKEKKLDAGDIVSFQRGVGEAGKHRLYIDWRRRPIAPDPLSAFPHHLQSVRWGRLYSLPHQSSLSNFPPSSYPPPPPPHHQFHHQQLNYGTIHHLQNPYAHNNYQHHPYFLRPPGATAQYPIAASSAAPAAGMGDHAPMVIDSVPVVHGKTVGKRLRLFGVNMECQPDDTAPGSPSAYHPHQKWGAMPMVGSIPSPHHHYLSSSSSSSIPSLQFQGVPTSSTTSQTAMHHGQQHEYSKKGKTSSLSFDLDL